MAVASLRRLAVNIDEGQFADAVELTQDIWPGFEWPEPFSCVAQPQADEGLKVRGVVGFQEFVDCGPVALEASWVTVTSCNFPRVAITTMTGRSSTMTQRDQFSDSSRSADL
jgi:hypothetical protein